MRGNGNLVLTVIWMAITAVAFSACGKNHDEEVIKAAKKGDAALLAELLEKGANVNAQDSKHQSTALMWAAHEGHTDAMKVLIKNGADIDAKRENGDTALWFTAQKGQLDAMKILAAKGADLNVIGRNGLSALAVAQKNDHLHIVEYLLKSGVKPPS